MKRIIIVLLCLTGLFIGCEKINECKFSHIVTHTIKNETELLKFLIQYPISTEQINAYFYFDDGLHKVNLDWEKDKYELFKKNGQLDRYEINIEHYDCTGE